MALFEVTYDEGPHLLLQEPQGFQVYIGRTKTWQPVLAAETPKVQTVLAAEVATGPYFGVSRSAGGRLDTYLRVGGPADQYKQVDFDGRKGRFTFDMLTSVCRCPDRLDALALVTTGGGRFVCPRGRRLESSHGCDGI
jgi:hypothetical protein